MTAPSSPSAAISVTSVVATLNLKELGVTVSKATDETQRRALEKIGG